MSQSSSSQSTEVDSSSQSTEVDSSSQSTEVDSDSSSSEGPTPAKRRRINPDHSFKEKMQNIIENLSDAAPGEFAVSGKLNAPIVTIAIKVFLKQ